LEEQRGGTDGCSRRRFLQAAGVGCVTSVAGCLGGNAASDTTVAILSAGSLQHALESGLKPAVDVPVQIEAHGSATVARMIAEGQRDPSIVTVADTALFEGTLSPSWYSVFTSNAVVLVYNPDTDGGQRLAAAGTERWYEPLLRDDVRIGRTDPNQDPLGYRTLFALELASRYYDDVSNLREQILRRGQIYPETGLISQFETGSIDAAFAYRNMAVERDYEYVALPDQVDLSNPEYNEDWYSTVSYELPSGQLIRGGTISYGSTIRNMSDAALSVFDVHTTGEYLDEYGFVLRDQFPRYEGEVPDAVRDATTEPTASPSARHTGTAKLASSVSEITLLV
jgi:molybdate/tungstate transport system substrate-binding protein